MSKKNILVTLLMLLISVPGWSQIQLPMPSPPASVYTQVGLTDVKIDYFRPRVKGRQIFGEGYDFLVPYGKMWRTGANSGAKISFSDDVKIMGKDVKAGEYLIYTIPGKNEWQVMLYSDLRLGGNMGAYDASKEVARVSVKPSSTGEKVEMLTFQIEEISEDNTTANITLSWENTKIRVPLTVSFDQKVMREIARNTKVNPANLLSAANYYYETGRDLDQALEWVNAYLETNSNQYWNVHLKAKILAKKGEKKAAIEAAKKSRELALSANNNDYVKMNDRIISDMSKK